MKTYWAFFKGISLFSKLVKLWTRSEYSHVAFLLNENVLIEVWGTNPFNVHWDFVSPPFSKHSPYTPIEIWSLNLPSEEYLTVEKFMKKLALKKTPYDWLGVLGFVLKIERQKKEGFFCSEGCAYALRKARKWKTIKPSHVSPVNFLNLIETMGGQKEREFVL